MIAPVRSADAGAAAHRAQRFHAVWVNSMCQKSFLLVPQCCWQHGTLTTPPPPRHSQLLRQPQLQSPSISGVWFPYVNGAQSLKSPSAQGFLPHRCFFGLARPAGPSRRSAVRRPAG